MHCYFSRRQVVSPGSPNMGTALELVLPEEFTKNMLHLGSERPEARDSTFFRKYAFRVQRAFIELLRGRFSYDPTGATQVVVIPSTVFMKICTPTHNDFRAGIENNPWVWGHETRYFSERSYKTFESLQLHSLKTRVPCLQTQGLFSTPALRFCVDVQTSITELQAQPRPVHSLSKAT